MSYITSNAKKTLSLILIAALLGASSCGGTESGKITDSSSPTDESTDTTAPVEKTYPFYDGVDLGGETFTVWNVKPNLWNMHCAIAPEEVDGETVNDAIYNRNAKVEAKMNYSLKEVNGEYDTRDVRRLHLRRRIYADVHRGLRAVAGLLQSS